MHGNKGKHMFAFHIQQIVDRLSTNDSRTRIFLVSLRANYF